MTDTDHRKEAEQAIEIAYNMLEEADEVNAARGATYTEENFLTRAEIYTQLAIGHALLIPKER